MKQLFIFLITLFPIIFLTNEAGAQQRFPCTLKVATKTISFANSSLLICNFGSDPEQKANGWTYAAGISFHRLFNRKLEFIAEADELSLGVDYKFGQGKLEIIQFIDTYPDFKTTPFFIETIDLNKIPAVHSRRIVYSPRKVSKDAVDNAISFLKMNEENYRKLAQQTNKSGFNDPNLLYEQLFILRDYAFIAPAMIAKELHKMENLWWSNSGGEIEEVFTSIQHDVSTISEILR